MAQVKVLKDWGSSEGYRVGDIVDISNPARLIEEGYAEATAEAPREPIAPVAAEEPEAPVAEVTPEAVTKEPKLPKETKVTAEVEGK